MLWISAISIGLVSAIMGRPSTWPSRPVRPMLITTSILLVICTAALAAAVAWGGPAKIKPLPSVNAPFHGVDFSAVPPAQRYSARDGASLAWYEYAPSPEASQRPALRVVLVHGSSSRARSMHVLAQALAAQGHSVAALEIGRAHV